MNNDKKMYFPKEDYLDDDLKQFLLDLKIVDELKIPEQFIDIEESEFTKFIEDELKISCKFSWIEDEDRFNSWIIELLKKMSCSDEEKETYRQKLYKLVDILIFDRCLKEDESCRHNPFDYTSIDTFNGFDMPILCKDSVYRICNKELIFNVCNEEFCEDYKTLVCDDKYIENKRYCKWVDLQNFEEITPETLIFKGKKYDDKYPLEFWRNVWVCNGKSNSDLYHKLFIIIYEGIHSLEGYSDKISAQQFLMELVSSHEELLDKDCKVVLNELVVKDYFEILYKSYNKPLKFIIDKEKSNILDEMINEIKKEVQFAEKYLDIESWLNNIVIVEDVKNEKLYTCMYTQHIEEDSEKPVLVLPHQKNIRKYRENIVNFLKNCFNISLDKKELTITAINNKNSYRIEFCNQNNFSELIQNQYVEIDQQNYKEELKRFFMEPFKFRKKYFSGYAKTCPFCGKIVETQMTSMRIKTLRLDEKQIEFLCCATCADLFYYCEGYPVIEVVKDEICINENRMEEMKKMLGDIESKIRLKFFIEPEYLSKPYVVEFEPRAAHRYWIVKKLGC